MEYVTLNNGVKMPILGFGVYQIKPSETERCVADALDVGYRAIDTAQVYQNEEGVGNAVKKSGIDRKDIFLTSKIWIVNAGYDKAKKSIEESLQRLQTNYIDLMLIHQPFGDYYGTYRAMEEAYKAGTLRAIGTSNFDPIRIIDLNAFNEITPAVNQIELNVFQQQVVSREIDKKYGIQVESWGPLAEGHNGLFSNEVLKAIGAQYGKTIAQTVLRYLIQLGVVVIPKSTHKDRMEENFNVFDFTLSDADMKKIAALNTNKTAFWSYEDPKVAEMFAVIGKQTGLD